jgi:hypothetical protein
MPTFNIQQKQLFSQSKIVLTHFQEYTNSHFGKINRNLVQHTLLLIVRNGKILRKKKGKARSLSPSIFRP